MPGPDGSETVHERDVFPQVGVKPETRWSNEVGDTEQDNAEDSHKEEETEKTEEAPT